MKAYSRYLALAFCAVIAQAARADINIGIVASATGPAAALGTDIQRTVALMPAEVAGQKVNYTFLDDATDPTTAVKDIHKLINENKVDAVIGPNTVPNSDAMAPVAAEIMPARPPAKAMIVAMLKEA